MIVGIIGSGIMGRQLILRNLLSSHEVIAYSRDPFETKIKLSKYLSSRIDEFNYETSGLKITNDFVDLRDANLILECLPENFEIKSKAIEEISTLFPEKLIATSTSSITLKRLSSSVKNPHCLFLLHFSNPVSKTNIAEVQYPFNVLSGPKNFLEKYLVSINVKAVIVPDIPGFVLNRILFAMLHEAIQLESKHSVSRFDIDSLMREGCGFPMGPFEIIDFIGEQTVREILKNLFPGSD